jgi:hypothetical protein
MIPEPPSTLGLWPLVKAQSLGWPTSNEDMARALAEAWRAGARGFATAAEFDAAPAAAFWPDRAGQGFTQRVRGELTSAAARSDDMQSLANRVDHFADVVIGVKSAIRDLIVVNLDRWAATDNFAAEDRDAVRASFVSRLAEEVDRLILGGSEQIGGPIPPPPPPPPPPPADFLTQAGAVLSVAGDQALAIGEAAGRHPELAAGVVLGTGLVVTGAAGVFGGGALAATGAGAAPGAAVVVGSAEVVGVGVALAGASGLGLLVAADNVPRGSDGKFAPRNGEPGRAGAEDEARAWDQLENEGLNVTRQETKVAAPGFTTPRKYDGTVEIDGKWYGIETKGNTGKKDVHQREFDAWLNTPGNTVQTSDGRTLEGVIDIIVGG